MRELEKILEEINEASFPLELLGEGDTRFITVSLVEEIIRNHMNDGWILVDDGLPEKPENGYQEPEYNVMIKDAIIPTTLKFTSKGKWKDDLGQEYEIIAWRPLPEPYRPERSEE